MFILEVSRQCASLLCFAAALCLLSGKTQDGGHGTPEQRDHDESALEFHSVLYGLAVDRTLPDHKKRLDQILRLPVLTNKHDSLPSNYNDSRRQIHDAGLSGFLELVPSLEAIARRFGDTKLRHLAFDSIHALHVLGMDYEYFLSTAENSKGNIDLAFYSTLMLGRWPGERAEKDAWEVYNLIGGNKLQSASSSVSGSTSEWSAYCRLASPSERIEFLIPRACPGLMRHKGSTAAIDPFLGLGAIACWARSELPRAYVAAEAQGLAAFAKHVEKQPLDSRFERERALQQCDVLMPLLPRDARLQWEVEREKLRPNSSGEKGR